MKPIIEVKGLSKKYRLGENQPYYTLRDSLAGIFKNPVAAVKSQLQKDEFWALKDVNFTVNQGEVVGIIGRNGAGKSTLLKILSQITPPTEGEVILRGRVGSLLEVGTGFSPELTGRENIFLNGAILGMKRSEVKKKFDEIVAFSEVEKFLDTPLKRYSSGMYMRLAFAVAAHLEPEILIVDEVLAVGDAEFQKKCLGKMGEVADEGRTVLFVSHNMGAVQQLCSSAIVLDDGSSNNGKESISSAINNYLFVNKKQLIWDKNNFEKLFFKLNKLYLSDSDGNIIQNRISFQDDTYVSIDCNLNEIDLSFQLGYALYDSNHNLMYWSYHNDTNKNNWPKLTKGRNIVRSMIPKNIIKNGNYTIYLLASLYFKEWISDPLMNSPSITFEIDGEKSDSPYITAERPGLLSPILKWDKFTIK